MSVKGHFALLIAEDNSYYVDDLLEFQNFLLSELYLDPSRVKIVSSSDGAHIFEQTKSFFENLKRDGHIDDVVILYSGYGYKGGFSPRKNALSYEEWGRLIDNEGSFFFINDSCYSGSAIKAFKKLGLLPEKGLVISSSSENEESLGGLSDALMECYRNREVFRIKRFEGEGIVSRIIDPRFIDNATGGYKTRHRTINIIHHPQRAGKALDYLLFKNKY